MKNIVMASIVMMAAGLGLCTPCMAASSDELVLDIAGALDSDSTPGADSSLAWIYMEASGSASLDDSTSNQPHFVSPRELLNRVSVGAWKWDNGTQLRISGDRVRVSYGSKVRVNFTVKPFRSSDTVSLTVNSSF